MENQYWFESESRVRSEVYVLKDTCLAAAKFYCWKHHENTKMYCAKGDTSYLYGEYQYNNGKPMFKKAPEGEEIAC